MDIGSLVQGLLAGTPAAVLPNAQATSEDGSSEAFSELLQGEGELLPQPDQLLWPLWTGAAAPSVILPEKPDGADPSALVSEEAASAVKTPTNGASQVHPADVVFNMRSAMENSFYSQAIGLPEAGDSVLALPIASQAIGQAVEPPDAARQQSGVRTESSDVKDIAISQGVLPQIPADVPSSGMVQQGADSGSAPMIHAAHLASQPSRSELAEIKSLAPSAAVPVPAATSEPSIPAVMGGPAPEATGSESVQSGTGMAKASQAKDLRPKEGATAALPSMDKPVILDARVEQLSGHRSGSQSAVDRLETASDVSPKLQPVEPPKAIGYWRLVLAGAMDETGQQSDSAGSAQIGDHKVAAAASNTPFAVSDPRMAQPEKTPVMATETNPVGALSSDVQGFTEDGLLADPDRRAQGAKDGPQAATPQAERGAQKASVLFSTEPKVQVEPAIALIPEFSLDSAGSLRETHHGNVRDSSALPPHFMLSQADKAEGAIRAASIERVQTQSGVEATEIRLDPEELGRLRITLEGEGEAVRVRVEVERPETLDLLRRNVDKLTETLREAGYTQSDMQFSTWSGQRQSSPEQSKAEFDPEVELSGQVSASMNVPPRAVVSVEGLNLRL